MSLKYNLLWDHFGANPVIDICLILHLSLNFIECLWLLRLYIRNIPISNPYSTKIYQVLLFYFLKCNLLHLPEDVLWSVQSCHPKHNTRPTAFICYTKEMIHSIICILNRNLYILQFFIRILHFLEVEFQSMRIHRVNFSSKRTQEKILPPYFVLD